MQISAKEWLAQSKNKRMEITALEDAILKLETELTKITPAMTGMPGGSGLSHDKIPDGVIKLVELKKRLEKIIKNFWDKENDIVTLISKLRNPIYIAILLRIYFLGQTLEQVSVAIGYSYFYTCRLHGYALQELEKMATDDNEKCSII